jgi:hypothetical protein
LTRTEGKLIALGERVTQGRLVDPAKIGAAADRILRDSGVGRCFTTTIRAGSFSWDHDQEALKYETDLLAGRYVIVTSLTKAQAPTAQVVRHYKTLLGVKRRFRVLKDFSGLRPIHHLTEKRVGDHIALCVLASVIEAVMVQDLVRAKVVDPDLGAQVPFPASSTALARAHPGRPAPGRRRDNPSGHHQTDGLPGQHPCRLRRRHQHLAVTTQRLKRTCGRCRYKMASARPGRSRSAELGPERCARATLSKRSSSGVPFPTTRLLNWYVPVYRHALPGEHGAAWL